MTDTANAPACRFRLRASLHREKAMVRVDEFEIRYLNFQTALFREPGDKLKFTFPKDYELAGEFVEQMVALDKEHIGDQQYLSVHHAETAEGRDDAPHAVALCTLAAASGQMGDILVG